MNELSLLRLLLCLSICIVSSSSSPSSSSLSKNTTIANTTTIYTTISSIYRQIDQQIQAIDINQQKRRRKRNLQSSTSYTTLLPLTKDKLQLIAFAALLGEIAYGTEEVENEAIALDEDTAAAIQYYDYGKDAFVTLQKDNYCYVAFRGSSRPYSIHDENIGTNVQDWFSQNFNFKSYYTSNRFNDNNGCTVQQGYYDAYISSGGAEEIIHPFIDECMASGTNELVLTGHSQGGAAAIIGGIINVDYTPIIITFGQPPVLKDDTGSCSLLESNKRIWRIINTENTAYRFRNRRLQYDPIPFIQTINNIPNTVRAYHIGEVIHLPPSDHQKVKSSIPNPEQSNVVYRSSDDVSYIKQSYFDYQFTSHQSITYTKKLQYIVDSLSSDTDEITTNGYIGGTQCRLEFDCQGDCVDYTCTSSAGDGENENDNNNNGDNNEEEEDNDNDSTNESDGKCNDNTDCTSGRCDYTWTGQKQCKVLLERGKFCTEDTDCQSNDCSWSWTCE
jgi:Lipase (class 3)